VALLMPCGHLCLTPDSAFRLALGGDCLADAAVRHRYAQTLLMLLREISQGPGQIQRDCARA
jgi:hypothetical protein